MGDIWNIKYDKSTGYVHDADTMDNKYSRIGYILYTDNQYDQYK